MKWSVRINITLISQLYINACGNKSFDGKQLIAISTELCKKCSIKINHLGIFLWKAIWKIEMNIYGSSLGQVEKSSVSRKACNINTSFCGVSKNKDSSENN